MECMCGEQMSETRRQFMQVPRWGVKSELGGGGGGGGGGSQLGLSAAWPKVDQAE